MSNLKTCIAAILLGSLVLSAVVRAEDHWPRFRGPNGVGSSDLKGVPTNWSEQDYEWTVPLEGIGHSSPSVWGKYLFLTSGKEDGSRSVYALNAETGQPLWSDTIHMAPSHLHKKNSYGSDTPATDGERVYIASADDEHYTVSAYTVDGKKLWMRDLGGFKSQHGVGVSPILYEGMVIVPNDQDGPSSIVALDALDGQVRWRPERKSDTASYSTPMVLHRQGRDQIIVLSGAEGLAGLDPRTGGTLWASGHLPQRTVASPVYGNGLLIATCGSGGRGQYMVAVDPLSSGSSLIRGERKQNLPYVPTPLIRDKYLYLWNDDGVVCCVDMTGDLTKNVWRERVGGNYSGSPVMIDGRIYCISEDGNVAVVDASPEYRFYGMSPLGDPSYATPAVANGRVYFRSFHRLTSLKAKMPGAVSE